MTCIAQRPALYQRVHLLATDGCSRGHFAWSQRHERQAISAEPRLIDVLEIVWGQFEAPGLASVERRHAGLQPLVGDMQVGQIGAIGRDAAEGIAVAFLLVEQSPRRIGSRQVYPVYLRPQFRSKARRVGKEGVRTVS